MTGFRKNLIIRQTLASDLGDVLAVVRSAFGSDEGEGLGVHP
jgi:hypothetical protein